MGLDMYLEARWFNWKDKKLKIEGVQGLDVDKVGCIEQRAAYWRKANAIHQWFVKNVQDGEDKCNKYAVSREKLKELIGICKEILEAKGENRMTLAKINLPTQSGFFFGATEYEGWYFEDLEYTVKALEKALKLPEGWEFEYQSSW